MQKSSNTDWFVPLEPECFYHVYNRGIDKQPIFLKNLNYYYFLKQYDQYLSAFVDTYAYCLLPNHFHFLIRIKPEEKIFNPSKPINHLVVEKSNKPDTLLVSKKISEQFRRLFISYSKAINQQESRKGSLFQKNFKRIRINTESYFNQLIYYIHANPERHLVIKDFQNYLFSSYQTIISKKPTKLKRDEVLERFESVENFKYYHTNKQELENIKRLTLEYNDE